MTLSRCFESGHIVQQRRELKTSVRITPAAILNPSHDAQTPGRHRKWQCSLIAKSQDFFWILIVILKITTLTCAADLSHFTSCYNRQTINKHHLTTVENEPQKKLPDDVPGMYLKQRSQTRSSSDVGKFSCRYACSWECTMKVLTTANATCISAIPAAWEKVKAFLAFFFCGPAHGDARPRDKD